MADRRGRDRPITDGADVASVPEQPVPILGDDALTALLACCRGDTFENRRDTAIIRLLVDTGMRSGELCGLGLDDVDFELQAAHVLGKGGRNRACPFGAKTADALRRYLRFRARHAAAGLQYLWLGKKGRLSDSGVRQMLAVAAIGALTAALIALALNRDRSSDR